MSLPLESIPAPLFLLLQGDVAKALGGGADFVMLGGMFSGHEESAGNVVEINGKKFKVRHAMYYIYIYVLWHVSRHN